MYNSLNFYYPSFSLMDSTTEGVFPLNVPWQLTNSNDWLKAEHFQHQQCTAIITRDYETNYCYEMQAFVVPQRSTSLVDPLYLEFTSILLMSSKLAYSQLTGSQTRSIFPGLVQTFSGSKGFQPFEWQSFLRIYSELCTPHYHSVQQLLVRYVAWVNFSKQYLSFYVRTATLEEDGRLSDTFSNHLISEWLGGRWLGPKSQELKAPFNGPTQVEVQNHLKHVKERISRIKAVSQATLISDLNLFINHWVSTWGLTVGWSTLSYCEDRLRRLLQRWAKRRHPNKGWGWVCNKYWRVSPNATKCVFWLGLFSNVESFANQSNGAQLSLSLSFKSQLVKLFKARLSECVSVETSSFNHWQFFCAESRENLVPYTVMSLRKWRKSRSFDYFLVY